MYGSKPRPWINFVWSIFWLLLWVVNIKTLDVGEYPEGINYYNKNKEVLVVNWFDSEVVVLNSENLNIKKKISVGEGPRGFGYFIGPNLVK